MNTTPHPSSQGSPRSLVLGLSAFGHDTSAALVDATTGEVLLAIAEERLSGIKHDSHFPIHSIDECNRLAASLGATITDVAVNHMPVEFIAGTLAAEVVRLVPDPARARRVAEKLIAVFEFGDGYQPGSFSHDCVEQTITEEALQAVAPELRARIGWYFNWACKFRRIGDIARRIYPQAGFHTVRHHLAHAAAAYMNSGFSEAAVLTIDGQGEFDTATILSASHEHGFEELAASTWPHSLGIFYWMATAHLGFALGDEYKVMGMAGYGTPRFVDALAEIVRVDDNGVLEFRDSAIFARQEVAGCPGHFYKNFTPALHGLVPGRAPGTPIAQEHLDFAASVQRITERVGVAMARAALRKSGRQDLAMAGGVCLNGLMNERIRLESGCRRLFVFPAAGDDGGSVGAAQFVAFHRPGCRPPVLAGIRNCFWGPPRGETEIVSALEAAGLTYERVPDIARRVAEAIAQDRIVAVFDGRSEFGPRALGHRSILANAANKDMKAILNARIKHREEFRPFAPVCLREHLADYFRLDVDSPFMLLVPASTDRAAETVPAGVHVDGTARVQTVDAESNPGLHAIVRHFHALTGIPIIINTSFNVNGEAIVETAQDAIEAYAHMDIDALAIGDFWVERRGNPHPLAALPDAEYLDIRKRRARARPVWPLNEFDVNRPYAFQPH